MFLIAFLIYFVGSGAAAQPTQTVDLIELNHKYCDVTGRLQFDQVIFWEWSPDYRRYDAVGWGLINDRHSLDELPDKRGKWYFCSVNWHRSGISKSQRFRALLYRETHTTYDPEQASRKLNRNSQSENDRWPN